jgi:hypothetical protein
MNGQDQSNTGETRWFGPDGRELTEREYVKLTQLSQQPGTAATPEAETAKPAGPAPGKGGPEK